MNRFKENQLFLGKTVKIRSWFFHKKKYDAEAQDTSYLPVSGMQAENKNPAWQRTD